MPEVVELRRVKLTPVIELEPGTFSTQDHSMPSGSIKEMPVEWGEYWCASLADSGISGISPIVPGSWHVSTSELTSSQLEKVLRVFLDDWGGLSSLNDPDSIPVLTGGLVLSSDEQEVFIEPTCCSDLGNTTNWKEAASFEGEQWEMLWIGHPWLSMKFQKPWLLLSDLHETEAPVERWAVKPGDLSRAVSAAVEELTRFSEMIATALVNCGYKGDAVRMSLKLAGLDDE